MQFFYLLKIFKNSNYNYNLPQKTLIIIKNIFCVETNYNYAREWRVLITHVKRVPVVAWAIHSLPPWRHSGTVDVLPGHPKCVMATRMLPGQSANPCRCGFVL